MKKSRFTETQIVAVLKEADAGKPVKEICRIHGISDATYYNYWKSKYGGMEVSDEAGEGTGGGERAVKTPVCGRGAGERGDEAPDRKKALKPAGRREAARYLVDRHRVSTRRACDCDCVGLTRSAYYTESVN